MRGLTARAYVCSAPRLACYSLNANKIPVQSSTISVDIG